MIAVLTTGGALFAMGQGQIDSVALAAAAVTVAAVGSLVPDIDYRSSWISNRIPADAHRGGRRVPLLVRCRSRVASRAGATGIGASLWTLLLDSARPFIGLAAVALTLEIALLLFAMFVAAAVEHRGPTHSLGVATALTLVASVGFVVAGQPWTLGLWFGWGYVSHLLADLVTPMGCPSLFWPLGSGNLAAVQAAGFPLMTPPASTRAGRTHRVGMRAPRARSILGF